MRSCSAALLKRERRSSRLKKTSCIGGFGSAVLEALQRHNLTQVKVSCLGIPDEFVEQGPQAVLRAHHGIDAEGIRAAVKKLLYGEDSHLGQYKKTALG